MIIIKLQGGLGNQLFQYATGKTIEKISGKEVKYDIASYDNQQNVTKRNFLLDKFDLNIKIATIDEVEEVRYPLGVISKAEYLCKKIINKYFLRKFHISYEPNFLDSIKNKESAYLEGYWQSFRYVEPCLYDLRREVTLKQYAVPKFENVKEEMQGGESVAVHIRRGDYLTAGVDLEVLDISYYKKASEYIAGKLGNAKYFVFTDDVMWAKGNLGFLGENNVVYVSDLGLKDFEELVLMAQCKNVIIANSSFSWWGAMLNENKDAIIICPNDWKNVLLKNDENLCPTEWIRV